LATVRTCQGLWMMSLTLGDLNEVPTLFVAILLEDVASSEYP